VDAQAMQATDRDGLAGAYDRARRSRLIPVLAGGGVFAPLCLLAVAGPIPVAGAELLILLGALLVRTEIIRLPHLLAQTPVRGR